MISIKIKFPYIICHYLVTHLLTYSMVQGPS